MVSVPATSPIVNNFSLIPEILKKQMSSVNTEDSGNRWVVWRYGKIQKNGKPEKVPIDAKTGDPASTNKPKTWSSYEQAESAYQTGEYSGLGFMFSYADNIVGIDLDHCRNPATGETAPWAAKIIAALQCYTEVSPSGTGYKLLCSANMEPTSRKVGHREIYNHRRFFTITGHHISSTPTDIVERTEQCQAFLKTLPAKVTHHIPIGSCRAPAQYTDEHILDLLHKAKNAPKFQHLWEGHIQAYESHSEADMALCSILAHYTSNPEQIDRLFRRSKLYRAKWDRPTGIPYNWLTIHNAIVDSARWKLEESKARIFSSSLFTGTAGNTQRLTLLCLYNIAQRSGKAKPKASIVSIQAPGRIVADSVGASRKSVNTALAWLVQQGIITKPPQNKKNIYAGNTYTISIVIDLEGATQAPYMFTFLMYDPKSAPSFYMHDVFRRGGLSKSCARFLAVLENGPVQTLEKIMELTGMKERTCKATAKRLREVRLLVRTDRGWEWGPNTLDAVAEQLGVVGKARQQLEKHEESRIIFKKKMKEGRKRLSDYSWVTEVPQPEGAWFGDESMPVDVVDLVDSWYFDDETLNL